MLEGGEIMQDLKNNQQDSSVAFVNNEQKKEHKTARGKRFLSTLAAGVIGSVLTLTIAPYTQNMNQWFSEDRQKASESTRQGDSNHMIQTHSISTQQTSAQTTSNSIADIVEEASKAIVGIVNIQQQESHFSGNQTVEKGTGSGIVFKKDKESAYIITNHHVIEGADKIEVSLYGGKKTTAELVGSDALTDIAVLKIHTQNDITTIEFGDSSVLRPGDQVLAIGNPLGLDLSRTVTQGIVSAVNRSITVPTSAGEWELNVIQTDAAINPGNSGGALINTKGQVVGINSLKISEDGVEGLGFAIPSNDFLPIVKELIEKGQVQRPYIGVGVANLEEIPQYYLNELPEHVQQGAVITNVDPNSPAGKAGLQIQDVIVKINGKEVQGVSDFRKYLYTKLKIGDEVKLTIYRQGILKTVKLTLTRTMSN
jgi:serine protease Do